MQFFLTQTPNGPRFFPTKGLAASAAVRYAAKMNRPVGKVHKVQILGKDNTVEFINILIARDYLSADAICELISRAQTRQAAEADAKYREEYKRA